MYQFLTLTKAVFTPKAIAFFVIAFWLFAGTAQAQVDTVYQKPTLNNGMPPAEVSPPVIIKAPEKPVFKPDTITKAAEETKEYKEPLLLKDRFFTGGGFGLSFGTYTNIQLSPVLGFKVTKWLAGGVGLTYVYIGSQFDSHNLLGKKVFAQGMIYKGIFAHAEYETFSVIGEKGNAEGILGGAGYRQMISNKVGLDLMLLLNLNQSAFSAYQDPFVYRLGFYIEL